MCGGREGGRGYGAILNAWNFLFSFANECRKNVYGAREGGFSKQKTKTLVAILQNA